MRMCLKVKRSCGEYLVLKYAHVLSDKLDLQLTMKSARTAANYVLFEVLIK